MSMKVKFNKFTPEEFIKAVKTSPNIRHVCIKLGIAPKGGNYNTIKRKIEYLNLDTSHFKPFNNLEHLNKVRQGVPLSEYLEGKATTLNTHHLKKRLIKEGYLIYQCYECGIHLWRGQELSLELHHMDGNRDNHRLSNLQILCPNCHSLTKTFKNRNRPLQ